MPFVKPHSAKSGKVASKWQTVPPEKKNDVPIRTNLWGPALLNTPSLNKGSAFTNEERATFGLDGFLPCEVHPLEQQVELAHAQCLEQPNVLLRHAFLASLRDQNQVLFYRLLQDHLKELISILYDPGVAEAVIHYSHIFRRPVGCFLSYPNRKGMYEQLKAHVQSENDEVVDFNYREELDIIVVTDAEAILGIGDQGVGGISISTSKAALYTIGAGVNPNRILSVVLDVGTDNQALFNDPQYLGWKRARLRGKEYEDFVDDFVNHCRELFPSAVIHFEDFGTYNAYHLLEKYRDKMPMFNDDIQGTGAVTLAGLISALKVIKQNMRDQRIVIFGAGSAGVGIADQIRDDLEVTEGLSREEASKRIWAVDRQGLLLTSMDDLRDSQKAYARPDSDIKDWHLEKPGHASLLDVVKNLKPTILLGTSTVPRAFNEEVITEMAKHVERPIIFPMSNPTKLCEVDPADAMKWTKGRALLATGSPFPPVQPDGQNIKKSHDIAQTNNAMIFPALGAGAAIAASKTISRSMIMAAVHALADMSPALKDSTASLLPPLSDVREVSVRIAAAVARQAFKEGNGQDPLTKEIVEGEHEMAQEDYIRSNMWDAVYRPLELVKGESHRGGGGGV